MADARAVDRGTHRISFEVLGPDDGPPLLMVMGLGLPAEAWEALPGRLSETFRVIVFDNRGTGRSSCSRRPYRMGHLADDAVAVLDALDVASAHVFGLSMGGMIALELALRHPGRVRSLVVGASTASFVRSKRLPAAVVVDLLRAQFLPGPRALDRLARVLVSDAYRAARPDAIESWLRRTAPAAPAVALLQLAAIVRHDVLGRLDQLAVPVLIVTGDADRLVLPDNSRRMARAIPGARLVELAGVGHCFPLEQTDETVRLLTAFFLEHEPAGRAATGAAG